MARIPLFQAGAKYEVFAGRLYVRDRRQTLTVKPWGRGMGAWRLQALNTWNEVNLEVDLAAIALRDEPWADSLLKQWPAEVVRAVVSVPVGQWALLRLANLAGAPFVQLLETNPALGALLGWAAERGASLETAAGWASLKRREILAAAGLEPSERAVRILAKIPAGAIEDGLFELFQALGQRWEELSYWEMVNARAVALVANPDLYALTSRQFRREFAAAQKTRQMEVLRALQTAAWHVEQLRLTLPPVQRLARLEAHAHGVWRLEQRLEDKRKAALRFAPPPVPPAPGMEAITDAAALGEEGEKMHHCCAGYLKDVRSGRRYFYRMLEPERLTVCLERRAGRWTLGEVRGVANRQPGREAVNQLRRWVGLGDC